MLNHQKGIASQLILIIVGIIILLILAYTFLAKPYKAVGESVVPPFTIGETVFAEKISYIFGKPKVGDRVIFTAIAGASDYIGIITKEEDQNGVTVYTIRSTGKGQPWTVSVDKIIRKIYYPALDQNEAKKIVESLNASSNIPTVTPKADETANWKTYTNTQWLYSLKYPPAYNVIGENMGSAEENLDVLIASAESMKTSTGYLSYPFLRVQVTSGVTAGLDIYANSSYNFNNKNNKINTNLEKFTNGNLIGWKYDFSGKSFFTTNNGGKTDGKSGFVINYSGKIKVIFLQNMDNIYVIWLADADPFNQILSTFKFTDTNTGTVKYTCPENGYQNCMPILDEEGQKQCTKEALDWKTANCPNFQGAAY